MRISNIDAFQRIVSRGGSDLEIVNLTIRDEHLAVSELKGFDFINCQFVSIDNEEISIDSCEFTNCTFIDCRLDQFIDCSFEGCDFERTKVNTFFDNMFDTCNFDHMIIDLMRQCKITSCEFKTFIFDQSNQILETSLFSLCVLRESCTIYDGVWNALGFNDCQIECELGDNLRVFNSILPENITKEVKWGPQKIIYEPIENAIDRQYYVDDGINITESKTYSNSIFYNVKFNDDSDYQDYHFNHCIFIDCEFVGSVWKGTFRNCHIANSEFGKIDIQPQTFATNCNFAEVGFESLRLTTNIQTSYFYRCDFEKVVFDTVNYLECRLAEITFKECQFIQSTLQDSKLDLLYFDVQNDVTNEGDLIFRRNEIYELTINSPDTQNILFEDNQSDVEEEWEQLNEEDDENSDLPQIPQRTVKKHGKIPENAEKQCFDPLMFSQEDIEEYLKTNDDAMVIFYEPKGIKKAQFKATCFTEEDIRRFINDESHILYECSDQILPQNYHNNTQLKKYVKLPVGDINIFVDYDSLKEKYEVGQNMIFLGFDRQIDKSMGHKTSRTMNFVSGYHCQDGSNIDVYRIIF